LIPSLLLSARSSFLISAQLLLRVEFSQLTVLYHPRRHLRFLQCPMLQLLLPVEFSQLTVLYHPRRHLRFLQRPMVQPRYLLQLLSRLPRQCLLPVQRPQCHPVSQLRVQLLLQHQRPPQVNQRRRRCLRLHQLESLQPLHQRSLLFHRAVLRTVRTQLLRLVSRLREEVRIFRQSV
jgi:hypothetical protein